MYWIAAILVIYVVLIGILTLSLKFRNKPKSNISREVFLSVIIPVRDEPYLQNLLGSLKKQAFPEDNYEVIIVDDHSTKIVESLRNEKIIYQADHLHGKKAALTTGIIEAKGNVIVTVDADCDVDPDFLSSIYNEFRTSDMVLSPGLIKYSPSKGLFEKLQAMETAAIMGSGVSLHNLGFTSLSNGANLSFLKSVWNECGGYEKHADIASGDDEFFVQEVVKRYPDKISYRTNPNSVVATPPNHSFYSFFQQRLRWAGKWKKHEGNHIKILAGITFIFHLGICAGLITLFTSFHILYIILFLLKLVAESLLIYRVTNQLKQPFSLIAIVLLQFIYSPYVVFFGVVSNFLTFNWKGRPYTH